MSTLDPAAAFDTTPLVGLVSAAVFTAAIAASIWAVTLLF